MEEVSLQEMLAAREQRSLCRPDCCSNTKKSDQFHLEHPGSGKVPDGVPQAFATGCQRIEALLKDRLGSGPAYGNDQRKNRI